jgi:hypothetical protein
MSCHCQSGHDCGCHGSAMSGGYVRRGRYVRMSGLGAMTPAAAQAQIVGSDSHVNASSKSAILASANAMQMLDASGNPAYIPGSVDCTAAQGIPTGAQTDLKLGQTASGLALTGVNVGLMATGTALGPLTAGISIAVSTIIGIFSVLVNHHAQAVKAEQTSLCSAVPAANNYLNVIANAVSTGLATPQDGISALESLKSDFRSTVGSIYNDCNAACVMFMELEAICLVMESQFQDMINSAAAAAAPAPVVSAAPAQVVTATRPNTTAPAVTAPVSSYSTFYSSTAPAPGSTIAPSTPALTTQPNTVAAPTSPVPSFTTAVPATAAAPGATGDWLPIAALAIGAIFLMRSL